MTNKKPFLKRVLHDIEVPLHQNLIYCLSHTAAWEQSLRAIWDAASWAAVLILPQIKLNSQLSSCTSFFSGQLWWPRRDPERTSFLRLDSTRNQSFGTSSGTLHPSASSGSADEFGKVSPGSWISHMGWDSEFYSVVEQVTCPLLVGRY